VVGEDPVNFDKLRDAEAVFLQSYPEGFASPELEAVRKRHNVARLAEFAASALAPNRFVNRGQVLDDIVRLVSRSSMISLFEKPKFRDYVQGLGRDDREWLAAGYERLLHGDQQRGFEHVLAVLSEGQLAKWSLLTIVMYQYRPQRDVFVKPTTTRNVIRQFELEGLVYRPRPSWAFYAAYREVIDVMKGHVHPALAPNNAAFTGFLMMSSAVSRP
jgi:hypothetical protein